MNEDVPWVGLRRSAAACGIGDRAFWRMSPRALIAITAGMTKGRPSGGRRIGRGAQTATVQRGGSLTDCP